MKQMIIGLCALILAASMSHRIAAAEERAHPETFVTTDITDLWWNPNESGWGLQVNQSGNIAFVTIFIYGTDGTPRWVTAQLTYIGNSTFSGAVYATSGPYFGLPTFDAAQVGIVQVGTMTFILNTVNSAQISYSIAGVVVNKNIQRQSLTLEPISGAYAGLANLTASSCTNTADNLQGSAGLAIVLNQSGSSVSGSFQLTAASTGPVCNIVGTYTEAGRMGRISSTYSCSSGEVGNMTLLELTNRIGMISGRLVGQSTNAGCAYSGRFSVLNPSVP